MRWALTSLRHNTAYEVGSKNEFGKLALQYRGFYYDYIGPACVDVLLDTTVGGQIFQRRQGGDLWH
jgi:hypothetical protein